MTDTPESNPAADLVRNDAQRRAAEAAESLAAEGAAVTVRSVRERARVSTAVATEAANAWKQEQEQQEAAPPLPSSFQTRIDALWRAAYDEAKGHFAIERDGLIAQLRASEEEQTRLLSDLAEEEAGRERAIQGLQSDLDEAHARIVSLEQQLEIERTRADRVAALEAQLMQLTERLTEPIVDSDD